jgi:hypothetical protein
MIRLVERPKPGADAIEYARRKQVDIVDEADARVLSRMHALIEQKTANLVLRIGYRQRHRVQPIGLA